MGWNLTSLGIGIGIIYLTGLPWLWYALPCILWWIDFYIDTVEQTFIFVGYCFTILREQQEIKSKKTEIQNFESEFENNNK